MILLVGPMPPPFHGQAICFQALKDHKESDWYFISTFRCNNQIINTLKVFFFLTKFILTNDIQTIYLSGSRSLLGLLKELPVYLLKGLGNYKIIFHLHGNEFYFSKNTTKITALIVKKFTDHFIYLADFLEPPILKGKQKNIVPNFFNPQFGRNNNISKPKKIVVSFLSNIIYSKGIFDFLDVAEILLDKKVDLEFQIAGKFMSDSYMTKTEIEVLFKKRYNKLKMKYNKGIQYYGVLDRSETAEFLSKSHILLFPSFYISEAYPLTLIEAMICGNAIITYDHNHLSKIIKHNLNGVVVNTGDTNALAKACNYLISNPSQVKFFREFNIDEAKNEYEVSNYIERIKMILQKV